MIDQLKSYYNKNNFKLSKEFIHPYEFHTFYSRLAKVFLVLDDEKIPKRNYYFHSFLMLNTAFSIVVSLVCLYGGILKRDIVQLTESGTYVIMFIYTLIILYCQKKNKIQYHFFYKMLREDFRFVCSDANIYRKQYFQSHLKSWKLCIRCFCFTFCAILMVLLSTLLLIFYFINRTPENDTGRPLLFPIWLFDQDPSESPFFEFFFIYTNYTMVFTGLVYTFNTQTQIMWVREIMAKADLIILALDDLMEDVYPTKDNKEKAYFEYLLKNRLRKIVIQHHSMFDALNNFADIFKKLLMIEQKIAGPIVCFTAHAATEKYVSHKEIQPVLIMLFFATFIVCIIPCYLCTILNEKVQSICDACFDVPFWNASRVVRPYLVLIMQRSLRPLPLQTPGFEEVSLKTFSNKMTSAYSMFNMLRQTNLGSLSNQ